VQKSLTFFYSALSVTRFAHPFLYDLVTIFCCLDGVNRVGEPVSLEDVLSVDPAKVYFNEENNEKVMQASDRSPF
ncbi:MAG: hypothetical protein ACK4TN_07480, partial [Brevinematales bacterium]